MEIEYGAIVQEIANLEVRLYTLWKQSSSLWKQVAKKIAEEDEKGNLKVTFDHNLKGDPQYLTAFIRKEYQPLLRHVLETIEKSYQELSLNYNKLHRLEDKEKLKEDK